MSNTNAITKLTQYIFIAHHDFRSTYYTQRKYKEIRIYNTKTFQLLFFGYLSIKINYEIKVKRERKLFNILYEDDLNI